MPPTNDILDVHPDKPSTPHPAKAHWHGATPDDYMEHLAMFETGDDSGTGTTWGARH